MEKATTKKLQILEENICLTSSDFLLSAFDSKQVLMLLTCLINDAEQSPPVFTTRKL